MQVASSLVRAAEIVDVDAHEGPVYVDDEHALYFTTLPQPGGRHRSVSIKRLDLDRRSTVSTVSSRERRTRANGMTLDLDGRLLVCEQGTPREPARISRRRPADRRRGDGRRRLRAACRSTRPTTSSSRATARSGSPIRATATCRASGPSRSSATTSTATTRRPASDGRRGLLRQAQRARVLARRAVALRRRQRRQPGGWQLPPRPPAPHPGVRRRRRPSARDGGSSPSPRPGFPDGIKVDCRGPRLRLVVRRRPGLRPRTAT